MPKFRLTVKQVVTAQLEFEAESADAARQMVNHPDFKLAGRPDIEVTRSKNCYRQLEEYGIGGYQGWTPVFGANAGEMLPAAVGHIETYYGASMQALVHEESLPSQLLDYAEPKVPIHCTCEETAVVLRLGDLNPESERTPTILVERRADRWVVLVGNHSGEEYQVRVSMLDDDTVHVDASEDFPDAPPLTMHTDRTVRLRHNISVRTLPVSRWRFRPHGDLAPIYADPNYK